MSFRSRAWAVTVCALLMYAAPSGAQGAWWVFMADRGPDLSLRLDARSVELAAGPSAERRASVGALEAGETDLLPYSGYVEVLRDIGCSIRVRSRLLNAVSVDIGRVTPARLEALPFVESVRPVGRSAPIPLPDKSAPGALDLSDGQLSQSGISELQQRGYTGRGVILGVLDTGFQLDHPCLQPLSVQSAWDFINGDPDVSQEPEDPPSQAQHGTAVLSLLGGLEEGVYSGGAPSASFLLAKTEDCGDEYPQEEDFWVAGLEWADSAGAWVVSSSLGYMDWYGYEDLDGNTAVTTIAADLAAAGGLMVYNAVGNDGPQSGTLIAPADGDSVFAVGAVRSSGQIAEFSSRGPTADGRTKPEGCCRGVNCVTAVWNGTGYQSGNGTSFATPLAASTAALLLEAHPEWNVFDVRGALLSTAGRADSPDNSYGWGVLDAAAAFRYGSVTGLVRRSDTGEPLDDYTLKVTVADTTAEVQTNSQGWFAWDPGRPGDFSVAGAGGWGTVLPSSGVLGQYGVELEVFVDPSVGPGAPSAYPNPSTGGFYIGFDVSEGPVAAELSIFDLSGNLVYNELRTGLESGVYRAPVSGEAFHWDGTDMEGATVAGGVYVALLRLGESAHLLKLAAVR